VEPKLNTNPSGVELLAEAEEENAGISTIGEEYCAGEDSDGFEDKMKTKPSGSELEPILGEDRKMAGKPTGLELELGGMPQVKDEAWLELLLV